MVTKLSYDEAHLQDRFDRNAAHWRDLYKGNGPFTYRDKQYRRKHVLELLGPGRGTVIDVGCGAGPFLEGLHDLGYHVLGVDNSTEMLKLARVEAERLANVRVDEGSALKLPIDDGKAAALIAIGLLEYLPEDGPFLREVLRVLRPGGMFVLTLRNGRCIERKLWKSYWALGIKRHDKFFFREHELGTFKQTCEPFGFAYRGHRLTHFYPLPWPLSVPLRPIDHFFAHKMEALFSSSQMERLASTVVCKFQKVG